MKKADSVWSGWFHLRLLVPLCCNHSVNDAQAFDKPFWPTLKHWAGKREGGQNGNNRIQFRLNVCGFLREQTWQMQRCETSKVSRLTLIKATRRFSSTSSPAGYDWSVREHSPASTDSIWWIKCDSVYVQGRWNREAIYCERIPQQYVHGNAFPVRRRWV